MLRIIESYGNLPEALPVNEKSEYHPGKFGMLTKDGVVASDGFNICGIIDDIKCSKLRHNGIIRFDDKDLFDDKLNFYFKKTLLI